MDMVSPVLLENDKSRIQRCSFLVHLKVSEDSQEKTGAVPSHSGWEYLGWRLINLETIIPNGQEACDWSSPNTKKRNDSN